MTRRILDLLCELEYECQRHDLPLPTITARRRFLDHLTREVDVADLHYPKINEALLRGGDFQLGGLRIIWRET